MIILLISFLAYIIHCELKGVYKRQSDRRYPYVIEVNMLFIPPPPPPSSHSLSPLPLPSHPPPPSYPPPHPPPPPPPPPPPFPPQTSLPHLPHYFLTPHVGRMV